MPNQSDTQIPIHCRVGDNAEHLIGTLTVNDRERFTTGEDTKTGIAAMLRATADAMDPATPGKASDPNTVIAIFERPDGHGWTCQLCGWVGVGHTSQLGALKESGRHLASRQHELAMDEDQG